MVKLRKRGEQIRQFILAHVNAHAQTVAALTAQEFGITRQAVNQHIQRLVAQNALTVEGSTRNRRYHLCPMMKWEKDYPLTEALAEDRVWVADVKPLLSDLPDNIRDIWWYGFSEMLNNAIDHSSGEIATVQVTRTALDTTIHIGDDGEGIFRKIQKALNLYDERQAILELSKGKLTTDPSRHSGQGIFFTSRMFDAFSIVSGQVYFSHEFTQLEDWIFEGSDRDGTFVTMTLQNNTARTVKQIFDQFSSGEDYAFTKTVVPVRLAQYGDEKLGSRSQAKRLLARVDKFKVVVFDFVGIEAIGQAFADEIFRVFQLQHPEIELIPLNANSDVVRMIRRAKSE